MQPSIENQTNQEIKPETFKINRDKKGKFCSSLKSIEKQATTYIEQQQNNFLYYSIILFLLISIFSYIKLSIYYQQNLMYCQFNESKTKQQYSRIQDFSYYQQISQNLFSSITQYIQNSFIDIAISQLTPKTQMTFKKTFFGQFQPILSQNQTNLEFYQEMPNIIETPQVLNFNISASFNSDIFEDIYSFFEPIATAIFSNKKQITKL